MSSPDPSPDPARSPGRGAGHPDDVTLRAVLDGVADAVHVYDEAWRWVYLNPTAAARVRAMGHDPEDLLGQRVWDVFPVEPHQQEAAERAVLEGREVAGEIQVGDRDGAWIETRVFPVRGGIVSVSRDVSHKRGSEERQRILAEASAILSESLDADATLSALARLAVDRFADYAISYVLDEAAGTLVRVAVAARHDEDALRTFLGEPIPVDADVAVARVVRSGEATLMSHLTDDDLRAAAPDDARLSVLRRVVPTSAVVVPLKARGRTLGAFAAATVEGGSRTYGEAELALLEELATRAALAYDNARLFEQAQAASRAKSQFLATISHELRTPLTAILGYADIMDAGISGPLTEPQRSHIRHIMMSTRHLVGVIDQILTFSRADAGREEVRLDDVDLDELMEEVVALLEPQAFAEGLKLVRVGEEGPFVVRTDPGKVRQIMLNLAGNAVKFTDRGTVTLSLTRDDDRAVLRVQDTGPGIEPQEIDRIFEPFTQVHEPDTRLHGGAGLGLAVCRRLATLLGGDVTVDTRPGEGSAFTLTLPA